MSDPNDNEDNVEDSSQEAEPEEIEAPDLVSIREGYTGDSKEE